MEIELEILKVKLERKEKDIVNLRKRLDDVLNEQDKYIVQNNELIAKLKAFPQHRKFAMRIQHINSYPFAKLPKHLEDDSE